MNKKVILTFGIATLSCGLASSALVAADDTQFTVTVNPYLNVTLSDSDIHLPITPSSNGTYGSANFSAYTSTNNAYGYKLNLTIKDGSAANANLTTDLKSNVVNVNTGVAPVIPTFSTNDVLTSTEFSASTSTDHINHWAMSINDTDHYQKVLSESTIATNDSPAIDDPTTINLATKLDLLTSPGSYSAYFNFAVVANPVPMPDNPINTAMEQGNKQPVEVGGNRYYKLQDMTTAICNSITTPVEDDLSDIPTTKMVDIRDNTIYTVGKLADGRCWMLDNLALDLTATNASTNITASNTNANATSLNALFGTANRDATEDSTGNLATAGVADWVTSDSFSVPLTNISNKNILPTTSNGIDDPLASNVTSGSWKVGAYYNYCAASAGSYCYDFSNFSSSIAVDKQNTAIDAEYDICPSGWRMPTGSSYDATERPDGGEYQALYEAYPTIEGGDNQDVRTRKALHLSLSGQFYNGSTSNQGDNGYIWSSTYRDSDSVYYLDVSTYNGSYVSTQSTRNRNNGNSVRCIAK